MKTLRDESKKKIVVFDEILDCSMKMEFLQKYDVRLFKEEKDLVLTNAFYLNQGAGHLHANKEVFWNQIIYRSFLLLVY
jgi:hypothetical protein